MSLLKNYKPDASFDTLRKNYSHAKKSFWNVMPLIKILISLNLLEHEISKTNLDSYNVYRFRLDQNPPSSFPPLPNGKSFLNRILILILNVRVISDLFTKFVRIGWLISVYSILGCKICPHSIFLEQLACCIHKISININPLDFSKARFFHRSSVLVPTCSQNQQWILAFRPF